MQHDENTCDPIDDRFSPVASALEEPFLPGNVQRFVHDRRMDEMSDLDETGRLTD